jgi:hypothetical protein
MAESDKRTSLSHRVAFSYWFRIVINKKILTIFYSSHLHKMGWGPYHISNEDFLSLLSIVKAPLA